MWCSGRRPSSCYNRLYRLALSKYLDTRIQKVDEALLAWAQLSTDILQQGFLSPDGFEPGAIRALLTQYFETRVKPLVVPAEDEPLRQFFAGVSCVDVGPRNFQQVCEAVFAQVNVAIQELQTELESKLQTKLVKYYEAFDIYLCTLEYYLGRFTDPVVRMNFAYCGTETACPQSVTRRSQVEDDVFMVSSDPRTFIPFQNTVRMSKLSLLNQEEMRLVAMMANLMPMAEVDPIQLELARFLNDDLYEQAIYESIATLDGSVPIEENDLLSQRRVLFDQFRKTPVFGVMKDVAARERLHWPLFEIRKMDPDGDQITLSYDLCPCWPEIRTQNAMDDDGDRVGNSCDGDWLFPHAAEVVTSMDDAGFGPPALGIKQSFVNRLDNTVKVACERHSTAEAINLLDNMLAEIRAHTDNAMMRPDTAQAMKAVVDELLAKFHAGAMRCVDSPPVGTVMACGGY